MKGLFTFFVFVGIIVPIFSFAQTDTTKTKKEAPQELKLLLEEITKQETQKTSSDVTLEIDGLLIDETRTKSGREFYDNFFRDWLPPQNAKNYTVFIIEKPFRLNTTTVEILVNEISVFQAFLQPRSEYLEELSQQSIGVTQKYLAQYDQIVRELDGEERKGTGIF